MSVCKDKVLLRQDKAIHDTNDTYEMQLYIYNMYLFFYLFILIFNI